MAEEIFHLWASKVPKYDAELKVLFETHANYGGGDEARAIARGKEFEVAYEMYIYCFFLGLYSKTKRAIPEDHSKIDFSMPISTWGKKSGRKARSDYFEIQKYMFMSCVAETQTNWTELEKGEIEADDAVKSLIKTLEEYTNGGLLLLKEAYQERPNSMRHDSSLANLIFQAKEDS